MGNVGGGAEGGGHMRTCIRTRLMIGDGEGTDSAQ